MDVHADVVHSGCPLSNSDCESNPDVGLLKLLYTFYPLSLSAPAKIQRQGVQPRALIMSALQVRLSMSPQSFDNDDLIFIATLLGLFPIDSMVSSPNVAL